MRRWEYQVFEISAYDESIEEVLNIEGREGWEVCGFTLVHSSADTRMLKDINPDHPTPYNKEVIGEHVHVIMKRELV